MAQHRQARETQGPAGKGGAAGLLDLLLNQLHAPISAVAELEEKYSAELVVIGIHSAKFTAEKSTTNVRKAVLRYEIEHPVVNDRNFEVWQRYSVRAWPTLMFIDPEGKVVGKHEGEISADAFDNLIGEDGQLLRPARPDGPNSPALQAGTEKELGARSPFRASSWRTRTPVGCSSPTPTTAGSSSPPWRGGCWKWWAP